MTFWTLFSRAIRLRCPSCGVGKPFAGLLRMHRHCGHCELEFEREKGYFLGSIYFNYGLTALLVTAVYLPLRWFELVSRLPLMIVTFSFALLFPIWFFRYARCLWMAMDHFFDPQTPVK